MNTSSSRTLNSINTIPLSAIAPSGGDDDDGHPAPPSTPRFVTIENDQVYREFRKTEQLEPNTRYKVLYLQKVFNKEYGARIRATLTDFKYDLPLNFLISLNRYNLDNIDYAPVYMYYMGRSDERHGAINIRLEGLPYRGDGINTIPYDNTDINTITRRRTNTSASSQRTRRTTSYRIERFHPFFTSPRTNHATSEAPVQDSATNNQTTETNADLPLEQLCKVCMVRPKNAIIMPCAHVGVCFDCGKTVKQKHKQCPFCRRKITRIVKMFDT